MSFGDIRLFRLIGFGQEGAVDAAFGDLSVMTTSESEMSNNDQVVCLEVLETNNSVSHINLNLVSINGYISFHSIGWINVTLSHSHIIAGVPGEIEIIRQS